MFISFFSPITAGRVEFLNMHVLQSFSKILIIIFTQSKLKCLEESSEEYLLNLECTVYNLDRKLLSNLSSSTTFESFLAGLGQKSNMQGMFPKLPIS